MYSFKRLLEWRRKPVRFKLNGQTDCVLACSCPRPQMSLWFRGSIGQEWRLEPCAAAGMWCKKSVMLTPWLSGPWSSLNDLLNNTKRPEKRTAVFSYEFAKPLYFIQRHCGKPWSFRIWFLSNVIFPCSTLGTPRKEDGHDQLTASATSLLSPVLWPWSSRLGKWWGWGRFCLTLLEMGPCYLGRSGNLWGLQSSSGTPTLLVSQASLACTKPDWTWFFLIGH